MVTPTKRATTMLVKMEMAMDERININRHQMVQEKTITGTKEIIVLPITRDQSQLVMEDQIEIKTTGTTTETTRDHLTTENNKIEITTLDKRRKEAHHHTNNQINVRIIVQRRNKANPKLKKNKNQLLALELVQRLLLRLALVHVPLKYLQFAPMDAQTLNL